MKSRPKKKISKRLKPTHTKSPRPTRMTSSLKTDKRHIAASTSTGIVGSSYEKITVPRKRGNIAQAWTPKLLKKGFVPVARTFLQLYQKVKPEITHGEAMFIIHLMDFKWDEQAPFPGYKTIAQYMGISVKQARRLAKSLEEKKYLVREIREATTNKFYLERLFLALESRMH